MEEKMEENKWKSRKFWMAVVAGVVGIVTTIWGGVAGGTVETVAGLILTVLVAIGYITAEAKVDAARIYYAGEANRLAAINHKKKIK
jgi:hypothetical protein